MKTTSIKTILRKPFGSRVPDIKFKRVCSITIFLCILRTFYVDFFSWLKLQILIFVSVVKKNIASFTIFSFFGITFDSQLIHDLFRLISVPPMVTSYLQGNYDHERVSYQLNLTMMQNKRTSIKCIVYDKRCNEKHGSYNLHVFLFSFPAVMVSCRPKNENTFDNVKILF